MRRGLDGFGDEIGLAFALLLNGAVFWCAWRAARRWSGDGVQAGVDAFLLYYLVQYLAVGVTGVLGVLGPGTMAAAAMVMAGGLWWVGHRGISRPAPVDAGSPANEAANAIGRAVLAGCFLFVIGYLGAVVRNQRYIPVMANDALTYHFPAAVQWLQMGWLGVYQTWFFNPANAYSPLAGSMFIAWLVAPMGVVTQGWSDVLARFVQAPALLFLFLAAVQLVRGLGGGMMAAAVTALALVLSRPFVSQTLLAKDDLFVAAFFTAAVTGLARLGDPVGPLRVGVAVGLLLATKYTALLAVPLLLLMADAPWRTGWRWRQWAAAGGAALLLAGPWYFRNLWLTGNPLYPLEVSIGGITLFEGLFGTMRSPVLANAGGAWAVLTGGYYSVPVGLAVVLLAGWAAAVVLRGRKILRRPLVRACVLGPPIAIGLFIAVSPYAEVRFAYPGFVLLFGCCGLAVPAAARERGGGRPQYWWPPAVLAGVAAVAILTGFAAFELLRGFVLTGAAVAAVGLGLWLLERRVLHLDRSRRQLVTLIAAAGLAVLVYVLWPSYVAVYREATMYSRMQRYEALGELWRFVESEVPPDAVVAYANTYFTYPLHGFELTRRVVYAPTRPDVRRLHDLPPVKRRLSGEQIPPEMVRLTIADPDPQAWLENLKGTGAAYLFIARRHDAQPHLARRPPEAAFAEQMPQRFERLFANEAGQVYRVLEEMD